MTCTNQIASHQAPLERDVSLVGCARCFAHQNILKSQTLMVGKKACLPYGNQKIPLLSGHYYHIYNRGNNGENLFREQRTPPIFSSCTSTKFIQLPTLTPIV